MNLDQYRAIVAQEAEANTQTEGQVASATPTQTINEPTTQAPTQDMSATPATPVVEEPTVNQPISGKISIEGIGDVDVDELKRGYLRQSDYTRKTQEISAKSKENEEAVALYQYLRQNPQVAQQMLDNPAMQSSFNPTVSKLSEIEENMYDLMLQNDIRNMQSKYEDFNIEAVLRIAESKNLTNLEDAYLIHKATQPAPATNIEDMKRQIREELVKELALEQKTTQTIIKSGGTNIVHDNKATLSETEHKVATNMGLSDSDYVKWRDMGKKK